MSFVATLVAYPSNPILTQEVGKKAANAVSALNLAWLADGIACDLFLPAKADIAVVENNLRMLIQELPIDLVIQKNENRRKKILVADMDSTIIEQECIDELADEAGLKDRVSEITIRAMNGDIDFETALHERVSLLKGLLLSKIDQVIKNRITLTSGSKILVSTMKKNGAYCALVSGGFTVFTRQVSRWVGFDEHRSNVLLENQGVLSGQVAKPVLDRRAKVKALDDICKAMGCSSEDVIAVGDGANDLGMLQRAGIGVAFHAQPIVAAKAKVTLNYADLTALLYLQGYRKSDFVKE